MFLQRSSRFPQKSPSKINQINENLNSKSKVMKNKILLSAFCLFALSSSFHSQETKNDEVSVSAPVEIIDRLNIPGPLKFNEVNISWLGVNRILQLGRNSNIS